MPIRGLGRPTAYKEPDGTRVVGTTSVTGHRKAGVEGLTIWYYRNGYEDGRLGKPSDPRAALEKAAGAGSLAHMMVENTIHGQAPLEGIDVVATDPALLELANKGLQSYLDWQALMGIEYVSTEEPLVCSEFHFGGTYDAIGRGKDGKLALIDWKSGNAIYGDFLIQMAAYRHLWDEHHPNQPIEAVYLLRFGKEHGDFHFHSWPLEVIDIGWKAFLHLRAVYDLDKQLAKVVK